MILDNLEILMWVEVNLTLLDSQSSIYSPKSWTLQSQPCTTLLNICPKETTLLSIRDCSSVTTSNNLWRIQGEKLTLLKYEEIVCVLKKNISKEVRYKVNASVVWHSILK